MSDVSKLQSVAFDIAVQVIKICEQHGIRYYLAEGSLLGAVRHQGFIPWDDDVDIALLRPDYERLIRVLPEALPPGYRMVHYTSTQDHPRFFVQVEQLDMPIMEDAFMKPFIRHMWIDLFPIDGMPANELHRKAHMMRLLFLRLVAQIAQADECINIKRRAPRLRRLFVNGCLMTGKVFRLNAQKCLARLDRAARKVDASRTGWTVSIGSLYKSRTIFPLAYYGEGKIVDFNGCRWRIPFNANHILKALYGEYMQLPPLKMRHGHELKILDNH